MQPELLFQFAQLTAVEEDVHPKEYLLEQEVCVLGRAAMCQIIVQRNLVSRLHARIEREGPRYILRDTGSVNGTFVNSQRISGPHLLANRDLIGLGSATPVLRFVDPDPTVVAGGRLRYDDQTLRFFNDHQPIELTPIQLRLLLHLYRHRGTVCTRESCALAIWGRDYDPGLDADALDRAISNLRGRLRQVVPDKEFIANRRGLGYEFVD